MGGLEGCPGKLKTLLLSSSEYTENSSVVALMFGLVNASKIRREIKHKSN